MSVEIPIDRFIPESPVDVLDLSLPGDAAGSRLPSPAPFRGLLPDPARPGRFHRRDERHQTRRSSTPRSRHAPMDGNGSGKLLCVDPFNKRDWNCTVSAEIPAVVISGDDAVPHFAADREVRTGLHQAEYLRHAAYLPSMRRWCIRRDLFFCGEKDFCHQRTACPAGFLSLCPLLPQGASGRNARTFSSATAGRYEGHAAHTSILSTRPFWQQAGSTSSHNNDYIHNNNINNHYEVLRQGARA